MIPRYQRFIQRLNNIQKVCILSNMLMDGLSLVRAPAATLAWRREVAQAFVLGYEILTWESDLPNPSLYLPIPVATSACEGEVARAVLSVPSRARMV